jgi:hypothetical protein
MEIRRSGHLCSYHREEIAMGWKETQMRRMAKINTKSKTNMDEAAKRALDGLSREQLEALLDALQPIVASSDSYFKTAGLTVQAGIRDYLSIKKLLTPAILAFLLQFGSGAQAADSLWGTAKDMLLAQFGGTPPSGMVQEEAETPTPLPYKVTPEKIVVTPPSEASQQDVPKNEENPLTGNKNWAKWVAEQENLKTRVPTIDDNAMAAAVKNLTPMESVTPIIDISDKPVKPVTPGVSGELTSPKPDFSKNRPRSENDYESIKSTIPPFGYRLETSKDDFGVITKAYVFSIYGSPRTSSNDLVRKLNNYFTKSEEEAKRNPPISPLPYTQDGIQKYVMQPEISEKLKELSSDISGVSNYDTNRNILKTVNPAKKPKKGFRWKF